MTDLDPKLLAHLRSVLTPPVPMTRLRIRHVLNGASLGVVFSTKGAEPETVDVAIKSDLVGQAKDMVERATPEEIERVRLDFAEYSAEYAALSASGSGTLSRAYEPSWPACFRSVLRREMKPFISVERLHDDGTIELLAGPATSETSPAPSTRKRVAS